MKTLLVLVSALRMVPHLVLFNTHRSREIMRHDVRRWMDICRLGQGSLQLGFLHLMTFLPEFRNLFYKRTGWASLPFRWLCPRMDSLFIYTEDIGPGLFIQHGVATIISAKSIGKDCWINQQVTIGYSSTADCPVLGDGVVVCAGAKVIGNVRMGDRSVAGANAVVVKDVPDGCTVVGVPARIVRRDGARVAE